MNQTKNLKDILYILIATIFVISSYFIFEKVFAFFNTKSFVIPEIFSAILGSVITVTIMAVMLKMQAKQDKEKEFLSQLFDKKLTSYQKILQLIFSADDDGIISKQEIQDIENLAGEICLLARRETVEVFAQFIYQLKVYGVIYFRNLTKKQMDDFRSFIKEEKTKSIENSILTTDKYNSTLEITGNEFDYFVSLDELIQAMRNGLDVVEGDISTIIERFVSIPYDKRSMIKNPNIVD